MFLFLAAGLFIAFHGLFPHLFDSHTAQRTMLELVYMLIGQFDSTLSLFEGDPNESVGFLLFMTYLVISNVSLMSIIIATFSVSFLIMTKSKSMFMVFWTFVALPLSLSLSFSLHRLFTKRLALRPRLTGAI